jgi:hypothetical protein
VAINPCGWTCTLKGSTGTMGLLETVNAATLGSPAWQHVLFSGEEGTGQFAPQQGGLIVVLACASPHTTLPVCSASSAANNAAVQFLTAFKLTLGDPSGNRGAPPDGRQEYRRARSLVLRCCSRIEQVLAVQARKPKPGRPNQAFLRFERGILIARVGHHEARDRNSRIHFLGRASCDFSTDFVGAHGSKSESEAAACNLLR